METSRKNKDDNFERIIKACVNLFAENDFHSICLKEIANKANVNVSMIPYYFKCKTSILIEILNRFFDLHLSTLKSSIVESDTKEQSIKRVFKNILIMIRQNTNICLIGYSNLPNNIQEVYDFKQNKTNQLTEIENQISKKVGIDFSLNRELTYILKTTVINTLIFHFKNKKFILQTYKIDFDDNYYETYCNILTKFFLYGITSFSRKKNV